MQASKQDTRPEKAVTEQKQTRALEELCSGVKTIPLMVVSTNDWVCQWYRGGRLVPGRCGNLQIGEFCWRTSHWACQIVLLLYNILKMSLLSSLSQRSDLHCSLRTFPTSLRSLEQKIWCQLLIPGQDSRYFCPLCFDNRSHQWKHNTIKPWIKQHASLTEKRDSKINFNRVLWSLLADRSPRQVAEVGQLFYMNLCPAEAEGPWPFSEKWKAGGMPEGHWFTSLSRIKEHTLSLKQKKIFPYKVISVSEAMKNLSW